MMGDQNEVGAGAFREQETFVKVHASFQCIPEKGGCGRWWNSSHFWLSSNPIEWMNCRHCREPGVILHALDERMPMDNYRCTRMWGGCGALWQEIRVQIENRDRECGECGRTPVLPDPGPPERRFGRRYYYKCVDETCRGRSGWQKASFRREIEHRCDNCENAGQVMMVRMTSDPKGFVGDGCRSKYEPKVRDHRPDLCDMCRQLIRQGRATSCYGFIRVVARVVRNADEIMLGEIIEAH